MPDTNMQTATGSIDAMQAIFHQQKAAFEAERHRPLSDRKADLEKIEELVKTRGDEFAAAIDADFGRRSKSETALAELGFTIATAKHSRQHLTKWASSKPVSVPMTLAPGKAYVRREPKGVVGIVSPWNYSMQLAFAPLVAALAAGCRVMIKPSEFTPRTAALIKSTLGELFSEDHVAVIEGGVEEASAFTALPFDHLFYTGSTQVGRIVAKAAAENLTPVTLELGGKSPAVVAPDFDGAEAAKTLAWGKFLNAGQTCVAPDYALVPRGSEQDFAKAVMHETGEMWPDVATNGDYTAIISERHHARLSEMVEEVRQAGAEVHQLAFNKADAGNTRIFPPTVLVNPPLDSKLMQEEIFGPILPVLGHDGLEDAARFINERDRPLALYVYAKSKQTARDFLGRTISGGAAVNIPLLHLSVEDLPFGGVGASGYGSYHGESGFLTFTHERGVFEAPVWHPSRLIRPPYGKMFEFFKKLQAG
ncbi:coniferyl aldehyde dehydrogenase [Oceanicaulis alexandrii]|uniref:coniferyl aldehyde dehydrogenase n=1 Tax=Oceanicaulis alexandrii TaxID=153233 RepID=UPI0003B5F494|nr:coniferyl aldehyde dehydrogenase [Oceanicaulis alexandrii]